MATASTFSTDLKSKIRSRHCSNFKSLSTSDVIFIFMLAWIPFSSSILASNDVSSFSYPGNWNNWKSPLARNSKIDGLYSNYLDGIEELQDIDEKDGHSLPVGHKHQDFPSEYENNDDESLPIPRGYNDIKRDIPREPIPSFHPGPLRYFHSQKKNLFSHELPWLRFVKPKTNGKVEKRGNEKRQLKILRLKKDPSTGDQTNDENNQNIPIFNTDKRYFSNPFNKATLSKKALKILRLKRFESATSSMSEGAPMSNLKSLNPNYMKSLSSNYMKYFGLNKRALKILRLKKNRNAHGDNVKKATEADDEDKPSKLILLRFGKSDPGLRSINSEHAGKRLFETNHNNIDLPHESNLNNYSRF